jgi:large subunit ribosomal protein L13
MVHLTHTTEALKQKEIKTKWHLIDAKGKVLGKIATDVASLLMGKGKTYYVPHLDCGDEIVVINAQQVVLTGNKENTKTLSRYSGYPGGLTKVPYKKMKDQNPSEIIRHAVSGMLPKNKLRDRRLARLHVVGGANHTFTQVNAEK